MLFDPGPQYSPVARTTDAGMFVVRVFHLTAAGDLACIDSRPVKAITARKLECRARRSDALDVEVYPASAVPAVPDGIKRVPRLGGPMKIEVWRDTLF